MFDTTAEDLQGWAQRAQDRSSQNDLLGATAALIPQTPPVAQPLDLLTFSAVLHELADHIVTWATEVDLGTGSADVPPEVTAKLDALPPALTDAFQQAFAEMLPLA